MKSFVFISALFMLSGALTALAQTPGSPTTQVEVSIGYVTPFLQRGQELLRSRDLRNQQLSYYQSPGGKRRSVGAYPTQQGFSFRVGYYKAIPNVPGLWLGTAVQAAMTGSQPRSGGYAEGYFFNFITAAVAAKYYPFKHNHLFINGEFGLASVLTKNRFLTDTGEQNFFHQFGIGSGPSIGLGYRFKPAARRSLALEGRVQYQQLSTRVEVNGIGDDQWKFGALHATVGVNF